MRRLLGLVLVGGVAAAAAGCLTLMPVGSHAERGTDFMRYRTYDWGPADALPVSDERLRENPFFVDDVHGAIDTELRNRGLVRVISEPADLLVHYHAAVNGRFESASRPEPIQRCVGADCRPRVIEFEAGTLIVDILDASTHRVIWRGWAEHRLEDMLDDPALVHRRVVNAVHGIMETLPLAVMTESRLVAPEVTR
jgi:hypothetical protein